MATKLKFRLGVADDPTALQPSLNDCLAAMLQQAEPMFIGVLQGLELGVSGAGSRRVQAFQAEGVKQVIAGLNADAATVAKTFITELTRLIYEGGGKDAKPAEILRFQDLQLFEDDQLEHSIEVARAQQEVALAAGDALPPLDALVSTMLGWRTIQPGLNPLRPEVFIRSLQVTLAAHVPDSQLREVLIVPAAGLLGVSLRRLYRALADWLRSTGVEPAVPPGGRIRKGSGARGTPVTDTVARTLLTLDRLRKLLAGDFDAPKNAEFLHTVPASMALLQDLKKADELVRRLEQRPRPTPAPQVELDMLAQVGAPAREAPRIGQQLGEEVVRLMFDHLNEDRRLLPGMKKQLKNLEPAIQRLAQQDSRFFSDRNHPARQLLDRITQRSLAFSSEQDAGWARFEAAIEQTSRSLASELIDGDTFGEMLDALEGEWRSHDVGLKARREEAARALLHAEQRNLLAQKLAADFQQLLQGLDVAEFIGDFLKGAWAQVVAEAQLSCADGASDPYGYRALVDDLVWSVQKTTARQGRARRLVQMIPSLLQRLREGLQRIGYPPELTQRFFDHLITLHRAALQDGHGAVAAQAQAEAEAAWAEESQLGDSAGEELPMWLDDTESQESGYLPDHAGHAQAQARRAGFDGQQREREGDEAAAARLAQRAPAPAPHSQELRIGTWVEICIKSDWVRAQLTWCSPHATLFMFTSIGGAAHSMSRRTLDKLRGSGELRIVAGRPIVEEALDQVAQAALNNSLEKKN